MAQREAWTEEGGLDLWERPLVSMKGVSVRMSLLGRQSVHIIIPNTIVLVTKAYKDKSIKVQTLG